MSEYSVIGRKRSQNLLVVEGSHEKNKLFWLLFQCYPEINVDMDDVWVYGTNIYMLYTDIVSEYGVEWSRDDIDLPFIISKKHYPDSIRYKEDFVNIILVFDYERHDTSFSEEKILEMQQYFTDATDRGKLYINYPMIESYQHLRTLPDEGYADRKIPVSLQPGKEYKELVRRETSLSMILGFPQKVVGLLHEHYGIQEEKIWKRCYDALLEVSDVLTLDETIQKILQDAIEIDRLQTARYQFKDLIMKLGYVQNGETYLEYLRNIFRQIICHNIYEAKRIQDGSSRLEDNKYRECFEQLDLIRILMIQNMCSRDVDNGFIWVVNTCVFFVAEYNFKLVMQ